MNSTTAARYAILACLFICCTNCPLRSQTKDVVELTLHARHVPDDPNAVRLLPREHELRDGNAAIELLRMPWEQSNYMNLELELMGDWLEMKGDDPELIGREDTFAFFKNKMRRAAYTRDADWDYPIGEQPLATILLPDVQGMRGFAGRVMSLWIRIQIAKGAVIEAEEGLRIQYACARHVCRTPFVVCQLVGAAISQMGFVQLEQLVQHPDADNYYYALGRLPNTFGDFNAAVDLGETMIQSTMPSIAGKPLPPIGDPVWQEASIQLFDNYIALFSVARKPDRKTLKRQSEIAAKDLPTLTGHSETQIARMSDEEICTRWFLAHSENISGRYMAAIQRPTHETVASLAKLNKTIDELNEKFVIRSHQEPPEGAVHVQLFDMYSTRSFISCHRMGRTAKLLQIVEAIRHHASQNDNQLPTSLDEIKLPIPLDPFTDKPANYEIKEGVVTLSWPTIPNVDENQNQQRTYKIRMKETK